MVCLRNICTCINTLHKIDNDDDDDGDDNNNNNNKHFKTCTSQPTAKTGPTLPVFIYFHIIIFYNIVTTVTLVGPHIGNTISLYFTLFLKNLL